MPTRSKKSASSSPNATPKAVKAGKAVKASKKSSPVSKQGAKSEATKSHVTKSQAAKSGATASSTPSTASTPATTPSSNPRNIEHVIVLMMENRSFDHILGYRPGVNGLKGDEFNLLDPTQPESTDNPAYSVSNGAPYAVLAGEGPGHSLNAANVQLCNNKTGPTPANPAQNNGFVNNYHTELVYADHVKNPGPAVLRVVMESFPPSRLPSINALADAFCLCDNWYSEVPGPTQPNRLYMHAATSFGYAHNVWSQKFDGPTIYNRIQDAGYTWATYSHDDNEVLEFNQVSQNTANFKAYEQSFAADVKADALANYIFLIPQFINATDAMANSQHAPQDARYGDNFIADVYETLRSNEAVWNKSVLIVTYDEHGGFYDHVVPPAQDIPNPDGINSPPAGDTVSFAPVFNFDRLGFRVPAIIASPWVKAGTVDSTRYQHTSVLATVREMFGLGDFLTKRDASANTFSHLFSEMEAPRSDTPQTLARTPLPQVSVSTDHPAHPANQPLDPTQKDVLMRAYSLTQSSHPTGPALDDLPQTQGEAARFIRERYAKHFGLYQKHGKSQAHPATPRRRRTGS